MSDFVSFKIAQKLKDKGFILEKTEIYGKFDSDGLFHSQLYFNYFETMDCDEIIAPTISQVLKWLREKGVDIYCTPNWHNKTDKYYVVCIVKDRIYNHGAYIDDNDFSTYEKAALAGIEYSLDNLI